MPSFTINIPAGELGDWIASFSQGWGPDSALTRAQWAKREIQALLRGTVRSYRQALAMIAVQEPEATVD